MSDQTEVLDLLFAGLLGRGADEDTARQEARRLLSQQRAEAIMLVHDLVSVQLGDHPSRTAVLQLLRSTAQIEAPEEW